MVKRYFEKFKNYSNGITKTPLDTQLLFQKNANESVLQVEYARVIGSLIYLTNCTQTDLAHAVKSIKSLYKQSMSYTLESHNKGIELSTVHQTLWAALW